jgi:ATP-dependent DNA helicase RecG
LGHRIPVEELRLPEGRVLVVHVPSRLPGTAWSLNGRYFKRAGDDLAHLADHELRTLFAEAGPDFSEQPCPGATLADLEPASLALFRERWARKSSDPRKRELSDQQTLRDAELLVDGDQVSYAALILFGTRAGLTRYLAQAELVFEYRAAEAAGPATDREEYRAGFLPGKTRCGKRSICAMTGRAFRTTSSEWTCPPSTRCRYAKPS